MNVKNLSTHLFVVSIAASCASSVDVDGGGASADGKADSIHIIDEIVTLKLTLPEGACMPGESCATPLTDATIELDGQRLKLGANTVNAKVYQVAGGALDLSPRGEYARTLQVVKVECARPGADIVNACESGVYARLHADPNAPAVLMDHGMVVPVTMQGVSLPGDSLHVSTRTQRPGALGEVTACGEGPSLVVSRDPHTQSTKGVLVATTRDLAVCSSTWVQPIRTKGVAVNPIDLYRLDVSVATTTMDILREGSFTVEGQTVDFFAAAKAEPLNGSAQGPVVAPIGTGLWVPRGSYDLAIHYTSITGQSINQRVSQTFGPTPCLACE